MQAVSGNRAKIIDTRKTLPGLRLAQKYAVRCGGGHIGQPGAGDLGVLDVRFETIVFAQHRSNTALGPAAGAVGQRVLGRRAMRNGVLPGTGARPFSSSLKAQLSPARPLPTMTTCVSAASVGVWAGVHHAVIAFRRACKPAAHR